MATVEEVYEDHEADLDALVDNVQAAVWGNNLMLFTGVLELFVERLGEKIDSVTQEMRDQA